MPAGDGGCESEVEAKARAVPPVPMPGVTGRRILPRRLVQQAAIAGTVRRAYEAWFQRMNRGLAVDGIEPIGSSLSPGPPRPADHSLA